MQVNLTQNLSSEESPPCCDAILPAGGTDVRGSLMGALQSRKMERCWSSGFETGCERSQTAAVVKPEGCRGAGKGEGRLQQARTVQSGYIGLDGEMISAHLSLYMSELAIP